MNRASPVLLLPLVLMGLISCGDSDETVLGPDEPNQPPPATTTTHSDHFSFLPPLAESQSSASDFDPSFLNYLSVSICEVSGNSCEGDPVALYTSEGDGPDALVVDQVTGQYSVDWHTRANQADAAFRISVLAAGIEFGSASLTLQEGGNGGNYEAGSTIPVRFWIEKGLVEQATIGPGGGVVFSDDRKFTVTVPAGALASETTFSTEYDSSLTSTSGELMTGGYRLSVETADADWAGHGDLLLTLRELTVPEATGESWIRFDVLLDQTETLWGAPDLISVDPDVSAELSIEVVGLSQFAQLARPSPLELAVVPEFVSAEEVDPQPNLSDVTSSSSTVVASAASLEGWGSIAECDEYPLRHNPNSIEPSTGRVALVLVHGWLKDVGDCTQFRWAQNWPKNNLPGENYLSELLSVLEPAIGSEYPIYVFTYPSHRRVSYSGSWLSDRIAELPEELRGVIIVAHSMGGLVSRAAIEQSAEGVLGLVTLATPHNGTPYPELTIANLFVGVRSPGGQDLLDPSTYLDEDLSVPLIAYGGDVSRRPRNTLTGLEIDTYSLLAHATGQDENDTVVPEPSSLPNYADRTVGFEYDHAELHKGVNNEADPTDPLFTELISDIRSLAEVGGFLEGRVVDGDTGSGLAGVSLLFESNTGATSEVSTQPDGAYTSLELPTGTYSVTVSRSGFVTTRLFGAEVVEAQTNTLETIPLAPTSPFPGGVSGSILDATSLSLITGATVEIREGINALGGTPLASIQSSGFGEYQFQGINAGTYTVSASAPGYSESYRTGIVIGDREVTGQDVVLSPDGQSSGQLRIVLTWGESPWDLDSHLTGPLVTGGRFHVYFGADGSLTSPPFAELDVDDVTSFGPETISVSETYSGLYRYSVHNYSNRGSTSSTALSESGAKVEVYSGNVLLQRFFVPQQAGTLWTVFEFENGAITPVNSMSYESDSGAVNLVAPGVGEGSGPAPTDGPLVRQVTREPKMR